MTNRVPTNFGDIFPCEGPCRDDYPNIVTDHNAAGQLVTLQEPAMRAYHHAEFLNGRKLPWKPRKPKAIRITGIGLRTCSSQTDLFHSDSHRFAPPESSRHCRGLAIDVFNTPDNLTRRAKAKLIACGFSFPVSGEPWHACFGPNPG
jgi:hypothetical protein